MLELRSITKDYDVAGEKVHALKGVSLAFRESEFVSILGPSGCGKTTLLNIIGGLDHYTTGDLQIDGVSTKDYNDRDWDTYRNHRIGFVFQSYNLIPHQTIQSNVELALSISGVEKNERVRRAREALDKVGLKGLYNKKPNQLSGGQMQRVAIARALVNDPDILLADEPTGALDSETSVQIMDLIKEISTNCLVIMVTHNPELAENYSTRIIRLLDGEVQSDSNPVSEDEQSAMRNKQSEAPEPDEQPQVTEVEAQAEQKAQEAVDGTVAPTPKKAKKRYDKKSKLSFWNAFKLSARNLLSKLKRTVLVCFAGSIGIIGVATVLAVSSGVHGFIEDMQDDMLSGNPVTVSTSAFDFGAIMSSMGGVDSGSALHKAAKKGYVNVDQMVKFLADRGKDLESASITNNITKEYVSYVKAMPKAYYADITTSYGINLSNNLFTDYELEPIEVDGEKVKNIRRMSLTGAIDMYSALLSKTEFAEYSGYISMVTESFKQAPSNVDYILSQYEFVSDKKTSKVATKADEVMIVVDDEVSLTDILLAQFGYFSQDEFLNIAYKAVDSENYDAALWKDKFSYNELIGKEFIWYPNNTVFNRASAEVEAKGTPFTYNAIADENWTTGKKLKITAILKPKAEVSYGCLSRGFFYTSALTQEILADSMNSEIVQYFNEKGIEDITGMEGVPTLPGITYEYSYFYDGEEISRKSMLGTSMDLSFMAGLFPGMPSMPASYTLTKRAVGGVDTPQTIAIYPKNFELKDEVTAYLDAWNGNKTLTVDGVQIAAEDRESITYIDNLALIIAMISDFIDIITYALVAFTSLSLVVSTVMIAIITYVSVIERIKEIGVIRSLGGRKRDVSALFIAETFIIGAISGIIGVAVTYLIQLIINLIVGNAVGIYSIAALPFPTALIMIALSIVLTLISGLIPARLAAKKDPVVALRTE
ncbi:MAG: ABC transporter ATP-binding protein/permease [Clostridiales bacterium]|nr:ABC transporter ATP-binding protein/permease [Clostridiales bacterium]